MNPTEAAICGRLREFREIIGWPQTVFAREVGITRDHLASLEYARTPLRYGLACRFAERYSINWRWLVTGEGSPQPHWTVTDKVEQRIPRKLLLSKAYSQFIEPEITPEFLNFLMLDERTGATQSVLPPANVPLTWPHQWFVMDAMRDAFNKLPQSARAGLCDDVLATINRCCVAHGVTTFTYSQTFGSKAKKVSASDELPLRATHHEPKGNVTMVDNSPAAGYSSSTDMKTRWRDYQKKLKELCKVRGTKAAIAKKLKVSRTMVSKWVDGSEPSYDLAVQVIEWIDAHWKAAPET